MTLDEIKALYERCLSGEATYEEQRLFEEYKDQFNLADVPWTSEMGDRNEVKARLKNDLDRLIRQHQRTSPHWYYWPAAAAVLIAFGIFWFTSGKKTPEQIAQTKTIQAPIYPKGNRAILILSNAQSVVLDSSKMGNVATQNNTTIVKNQKHWLQYKPDGIAASGSTEFHILITPKGSQYGVQMSDGTRVWLNADSRLRYPVNFTGKERVVELSGEAYFEVAKNKNMPFKVITGTKTVEVLGTHFNVSAYSNDTYRTTLLEGSVRLNSTNGGSAILRPNEQGVFNNAGHFDVMQADTAATVAWKNGIFLFRNERIGEIMKEISRWYDVDVAYQGDVSKIKLAGTVSRYANIASLLNTMQLTGSVHFKIEGRRVIVMR